MIKKSIVAIVVIVAAAALIFSVSGNHLNSTSNSDQGKQQPSINSSDKSNNSTSNNGSTSNNSVKISSADAQKIAQKYIEEPGASAGTPKLTKINGNYVYTVPVIINGTNVGEIDIDANTGKNVGGAGGAPQ